MLLNTAMLERGRWKVCASWCRKTVTNHNSIDAGEIHSATTNCPKQKYSSLYEQVLLIAEGYRKSNQEEIVVESIQNGSGDPFCLHNTLLRAKPLPAVTFGDSHTSTDTAPSTAIFCMSAQGPQNISKSTESLDRGTLSAIYRFSIICKCQSSLIVTTELRKYQQGLYFNGNSLVYKLFQNPSSL